MPADKVHDQAVQADKVLHLRAPEAFDDLPVPAVPVNVVEGNVALVEEFKQGAALQYPVPDGAFIAAGATSAVAPVGQFSPYPCVEVKAAHPPNRPRHTPGLAAAGGGQAVVVFDYLPE